MIQTQNSLLYNKNKNFIDQQTDPTKPLIFDLFSGRQLRPSDQTSRAQTEPEDRRARLSRRSTAMWRRRLHRQVPVLRQQPRRLQGWLG